VLSQLRSKDSDFATNNSYLIATFGLAHNEFYYFTPGKVKVGTGRVPYYFLAGSAWYHNFPTTSGPNNNLLVPWAAGFALCLSTRADGQIYRERIRPGYREMAHPTSGNQLPIGLL